LDARVDLGSGAADRPRSASAKATGDRKETLAVLALCLLTAAQTVVVVLLCIDVVRTAFG